MWLSIEELFRVVWTLPACKQRTALSEKIKKPGKYINKYIQAHNCNQIEDIIRPSSDP